MGFSSPVLGATIPWRSCSTLSTIQFRAAGWFSGCSVLYSAYRMATTGTFDQAGELAHSLGRLVLVSGCAGIATAIALQVGDAFAHWILDVTHVSFSNLVIFTALTNQAVLMLVAIVVIVVVLKVLGLF